VSLLDRAGGTMTMTVDSAAVVVEPVGSRSQPQFTLFSFEQVPQG
jgi:hypothetical protein